MLEEIFYDSFENFINFIRLLLIQAHADINFFKGNGVRVRGHSERFNGLGFRLVGKQFQIPIHLLTVFHDF